MFTFVLVVTGLHRDCSYHRLAYLNPIDRESSLMDLLECEICNRPIFLPLEIRGHGSCIQQENGLLCLFEQLVFYVSRKNVKVCNYGVRCAIFIGDVHTIEQLISCHKNLQHFLFAYFKR